MTLVWFRTPAAAGTSHRRGYRWYRWLGYRKLWQVRLALQMDHNRSVRGRAGLILTKHHRAGEAVLSSRPGLAPSALEVFDGLDFWDVIARRVSSGQRVDRFVDEMGVDVQGLAITADFRTSCLPGRHG